MNKFLNPTLKKLNLTRSVALIAFTIGGALAPLEFVTANTNLIDATYGVGAGSFELGNFINGGADGASYGSTGFMGLAVGSTAITGWTVGGPGDGVDWLTTTEYGAEDGVHSVDLTHLTASSIFTTIPTITGAVYDLSFGAAAFAGGTSNTGSVSAGSLNQNFTATLSDTTALQTFDPFLLQFTATGPLTTITFTATNQIPGPSYGPVIDSVSVSAVPVPAAVWLFSSALAGFVGFSRRKNFLY